MPKYTMNPDDMDESYGASAPVTRPAEAETVDQEEAESNTAIVANKILSPDGEPLKAGDEIVVRIVKNYGDESEIEYAPKEGGSETTAEPESVEAGELAALSEEGA